LPRRCNKREREFFSSSRPAPLPIHGERLFLCLRGGIGKREGRNCFYGGVLPVDKMDYLDNRDGMEDGK
ncbi:hypothetical protein, partial [[Clostridium] scindens]|uniref:hypothetical protein n=1 Tax=Clostridium scindens (strain JCM 10418 / VPI 12708) TaxID=29347 RepID=UPI001AA0D1C1